MADQEQNRLKRAGRALELLFAVPEHDGSFAFPSGTLPELLAALFSPPPSGAARMVDYANRLAKESGGRPLAELLAALLFDAMIGNRLLPKELEQPEPSANARFLLDAAQEIWNGAAAVGEKLAAEQDRAFPSTLDFFAALPSFSTAAILEADRFRQTRMFRYHNGKFKATAFDSIKPLSKFFGFPGVRVQFQDHFHKFSTGKSNLPLLINSLPGHGKTSMVLSYAFSESDLILILPDPITLETGWNELISPLAARPDLRFLLFFDDINPEETDWFNFRTNVGGAFSLPPNILPVLSANYEFPANILSRGRRISFPLFDELRCTEMVEDYLATFGISLRGGRHLVSQIAADYTEEFGQKKFTELSPRSLVRYLEAYEHDQNKRRTIAELATGPMVTRPDPQLFYEFNIDLMRSLYGDEYIKRLLKEQLDDLSNG